jgi:hypothetical protein
VGRLMPEGSGGLSADGSLLCIRHSEHGDVIHPALRILDATSGDAVAEISDPGRALDPVAWSPARPSLLFTSERGPFERPAVWDASTGARRDLDIDPPGGTLPIAWYPDGEAILVRQEHEAVDRLYRVDVRSGATRLAADPGGEIESAVVRPTGRSGSRSATGRMRSVRRRAASRSSSPHRTIPRPVGRSARSGSGTRPGTGSRHSW